MNSETSPELFDILEHCRAILSEARVDWKKLNEKLSSVIFDPEIDQSTIARDFVFDIAEYLKRSGFKEVGEGRHRIAFLSPTGLNVIKVPLNQEGLNDNERESRYWKKYVKSARVRLKARDGKLDVNDENKICLARCRIMGIFLVMEFVDNNVPAQKHPEWSKYIDCGQVGVNRKGDVVAYDYA